MSYSFQVTIKENFTNFTNPISIFNTIRKHFTNSVFFEMYDKTTNQSLTYICCNPVASIKIDKNKLVSNFPDGKTISKTISSDQSVVTQLQNFVQQFSFQKHDLPYVNNALFGFMSYDAVQYFESFKWMQKNDSLAVPDVLYTLYQNVIVVDAEKKKTFLLHYFQNTDEIDLLEKVLQNQEVTPTTFTTKGNVSSAISDIEFKEMVAKAKAHCSRGDVFQLVLSKRFSQSFEGDEWQLFNTLRKINPSPYMYYYDYEEFKILGCSPEAQLIVHQKQAEIHPIAGTYKRSGCDITDADLALKLSEDAKENAEHVMLVDLARNDLSKNANNVKVAVYKEIQYFSHVIHLVSKVTAKIENNSDMLPLVAATFPAGTLSGAPKYKAMELISKYEPVNREFYGGAIGFVDFEGNFNHAIMIRTFLSKNKNLYWQSGAGIVMHSDENRELQEVYNKSGALFKAIELTNLQTL